jgi:hypothetical protein
MNSQVEEFVKSLEVFLREIHQEQNIRHEGQRKARKATRKYQARE